jgi:thiamine-monophosphate kinase
LNERDKIDRIAALLGSVEIGDDAAVVDHGGGPLVLTVDEQVEGTHFERALLSFEDVGYRATMAAASDLAAMGARPLAALASWVLPVDFADADVEAIARGQRQACDELGAQVISSGARAPMVVGGNLARGPVVSISTTWVGTCESPITRAGAKPGDGIWICGAVGLAAAGFRALSNKTAATEEMIRAWRRPRALIAEGLRMARVAHACIDVSDGLASDAGHMARASQIAIRLEGAFDDDALHGGEDYALLCASPVPIEGFTRIGIVAAGEGVFLGDRRIEGGFDHFA